jgi:hypothetical protein
MDNITVRRDDPITSMAITYRWRGRVIVVCHIVIGCVHLLWVLHSALHNRISHWRRDALPVSAFITSHLGVLIHMSKRRT